MEIGLQVSKADPARRGFKKSTMCISFEQKRCREISSESSNWIPSKWPMVKGVWVQKSGAKNQWREQVALDAKLGVTASE
jgi:hypothetical protein